MSKAKANEQSNKINEIKQEIADLRTKLNQINEEKESWFSKKEKAKQEIDSLISQIKELKKERDALTKFVKENKGLREKLNSEIREKIARIKEAKKARDELKGTLNIRKTPEDLERGIKALEFKIETQGPSFEEEKKLMKVIKQMKNELKVAKISTGVFESVATLSREIDRLKRDADRIHLEIQNAAAESQKKHEKLIELSKQVDELRVTEEQAYKQFFELKKQFTELNNGLKEKLVVMGEFKDEIDAMRAESRKERKQREKLIIQEKEKEVTEKIKTGKKLTTEDLLVFQKAEMEKGEDLDLKEESEGSKEPAKK